MTDQRPETLEEAAEALREDRLLTELEQVSKKTTLLWVQNNLHRLTIKPKPLTPVDLSVLVDGIDCEFWDKDVSKLTIGKLYRIGHNTEELRYNCKGHGNFRYCRPRLNHIHAHQGGECPLPEGVKVRVRYWTRRHSEGDATDIHIEWRDVAQYEVLGCMPGYCWQRDQELDGFDRTASHSADTEVSSG